MSLSRSAETNVDPFSQVLVALGARSVRGTTLEAAGDWALSFDGRARLKFVAVTRGRCWLLLPSRPPDEITEGDVVLINNTHYTVASSPEIDPADGMPLYAAPGQNIVRLGAADETAMIGGGSGFADGSASFVLDALPTFLRVDRTSPTAEIVASTLKSLRNEVSGTNLGSSLVAEHLAEVLIVVAERVVCLSRTSRFLVRYATR